MLTSIAQWYARRAVRVAGHTRVADPRERPVAVAALQAEDAAFLTRRAMSEGRWRDALEHTLRARRLSLLVSSQLHRDHRTGVPEPRARDEPSAT